MPLSTRQQDSLPYISEEEVTMVWIIGLVTMGALIWLLAVMMAAESDSERRRRSGLTMGEDMSASGSTHRRAA